MYILDVILFWIFIILVVCLLVLLVVSIDLFNVFLFLFINSFFVLLSIECDWFMDCLVLEIFLSVLLMSFFVIFVLFIIFVMIWFILFICFVSNWSCFWRVWLVEFDFFVFFRRLLIVFLSFLRWCLKLGFIIIFLLELELNWFMILMSFWMLIFSWLIRSWILL